jgi:hypothetical protein
MIPQRWRKAWRRAYQRREDAATFGVVNGGYRQFENYQRFAEHFRARTAEMRLWSRMKRKACQRAAGIG